MKYISYTLLLLADSQIAAYLYMHKAYVFCEFYIGRYCQNFFKEFFKDVWSRRDIDMV